MRPASAKAKGRRLQQAVRDLLLKYAPHLQPDDVRSTSMGAAGEDIQLSPAARQTYPFSFECKNVEKLNVHEALGQAEANCSRPVDTYNPIRCVPALVFKRNNSKTYVALEFEEFLKLVTRK